MDVKKKKRGRGVTAMMNLKKERLYFSEMWISDGIVIKYERILGEVSEAPYISRTHKIHLGQEWAKVKI